MSRVSKLVFLLLIFVAAVAGWVARGYLSLDGNLPIQLEKPRERTLDRYAFDNLITATIQLGKFEIENPLKEDKDYTSYLFNFTFTPSLDPKVIKMTTGQINIPTNGLSFPVIVMFRGYINQETYRTGDGTRNAAAFFAQNSFITIAPDFLGYGGSDSETGKIFESRFQTYVTALTLLRTIEALPTHPGLISGPSHLVPLLTTHNPQLFIWGHSNGGQIALTTLELSGVSYPTVLWAPVSKPFPYSILYYTDESDDGGKLIRHELAKFEADYDTDKYSLTNYLDKINAPIQINQGTTDDAVPKVWTDSLASRLKKLEKDVTYNIYPGADHNLRPSWDDVVAKDLDFFKSHLTSN